jgi:hypothetical protein
VRDTYVSGAQPVGVRHLLSDITVTARQDLFEGNREG